MLINETLTECIILIKWKLCVQANEAVHTLHIKINECYIINGIKHNIIMHNISYYK